MNRVPMTTREAIKIAVEELAHSYTSDPYEPILVAAKLLCEQYGLKLSDYFDNV